MAAKSKKKRKKASPLGGVPLGGALDVAEGVGGLLVDYLSRKYRVEETVENIREDAEEKVEEIRTEAVRTGYAVKKAFFRSMMEAILLSTGMLALIAGLILVIGNTFPLEYVLLGYGLLTMALLALQLKLAPEPEKE